MIDSSSSFPSSLADRFSRLRAHCTFRSFLKPSDSFISVSYKARSVDSLFYSASNFPAVQAPGLVASSSTTHTHSKPFSKHSQDVRSTRDRSVCDLRVRAFLRTRPRSSPGNETGDSFQREVYRRKVRTFRAPSIPCASAFGSLG